MKTQQLNVADEKLSSNPSEQVIENSQVVVEDGQGGVTVTPMVARAAE